MTQDDAWKVCSICRTPIPYGSQYLACSVSTCRSKRTGLYFCSLPCFEAHLPEMRHRDAWAEQERAPTREQVAAENSQPNATEASRSSSEVRRRIVGGSSGSAGGSGGGADNEPPEVLVVVSKLKKFVRDRSGMNTSDTAVPVLSEHLRWLSVEALRQAAMDGRKTVMDRDYEIVIQRLKKGANTA